jgi:dihydrosphingosine 1-phosphate phosphatase
MILPPIFRFLSQAIHLPHRRFYTPATEYKSVPSEFFHSSTEDRGAGKFGLHPIPSVIDLPSRAGVGIEVGGIGGGSGELKMRVGGGPGNRRGDGGELNEKTRDEDELYTTLNDKEKVGKDEQIPDVKHYDADGKLKFFFFDNNTNR